jgi:lysozyme
MKYSKQGLQLTEKFEGCKLDAYLDQVGVPTIGYGHTRGVKISDTCTQEQAEKYLLEDITIAEQDVNNNLKVEVTQSEFDSLVDFTFNLGCSAFNNSTLLKDINDRNFQSAIGEFEKWDHAGGKVVSGLLKRRLAEQEQFKEGL